MSCCCDPPLPRSSEFIGDCSQCANGMPRCWEIAVAGITNSGCTRCTLQNGTWILRSERDPEAGSVTAQIELVIGARIDVCRYRTAERKPQNVTDFKCFLDSDNSLPMWFFGYQFSSSKWWLYSAIWGATYAIAAGSFDCSGPNVLTRQTSGSADCANLPATITIEPVACP